MGRYTQNKAKRAGRYNPAKDKGADGIHIVVVIILMLLSGAGGFFARQLIDNLKDVVNPEIRALAVPLATKNTDAVKTSPVSDGTETTDDAFEVQQVPGEQIILPELDSSDTPMREAIIQIAPELAPWLNTGQLIRTYLTLANDFSQGLRINKHMRFLNQGAPFAADQNETGLVIAARSYQRYDKLAQAIDTVDVPAILAVYKKFRPLFEQVFSEFGYPSEYSLEDIFTKAAAEILAAPVIDGPVALAKTSSHYKFADPQLEALNPVHKQIIRMGAKNTRIIQNKVRLLDEEIAGLKD
ncbi:MAG: DUF3014 domain-containing protein [Methylovulum sp.]|nr:DUF3014 domain-containing protein [Methylovulum sp.]